MIYILMPAKVDIECCNACGDCVEECPVDAITLEDHAVVDEAECIDCGQCVDICPDSCITVE